MVRSGVASEIVRDAGRHAGAAGARFTWPTTRLATALAGWAIARALRVVYRTLQVRLVDPAGVPLLVWRLGWPRCADSEAMLAARAALAAALVHVSGEAAAAVGAPAS